jgi:hypothetical protein
MDADEHGFFLKSLVSSLQKLIAENAESAEIFFNIALRTLRSLR